MKQFIILLMLAALFSCAKKDKHVPKGPERIIGLGIFFIDTTQPPISDILMKEKREVLKLDTNDFTKNNYEIDSAFFYAKIDSSKKIKTSSGTDSFGRVPVEVPVRFVKAFVTEMHYQNPK